MTYTRTIKRPTRKKAKKGSRKLPFIPNAVQSFLARRILDITAITFLIGGLFTAIALLTYSNADPSINTARSVSESETIQNWGGSIGASIADVFAQTIGIGGFAIALGLCIWGTRMIKRQPMQFFTFRVVALLTSGFLIALAYAQVPSGGWLAHPYMGSSTGTLLHEFLTQALSIPTVLLFLGGNIIAFGLFMFATGTRKSEVTSFTYKIYSAIKSSILFAYAHIDRFFSWIKHYNDPDYSAAPIVSLREKKKKEKKAPTLNTSDDSDAARSINNVTNTAKIPVVAPKQKTDTAVSQKQKTFQYDGIWELPSAELLESSQGNEDDNTPDENALRKNAELLQNVLADFKIDGEIVSIHPGPVVTLYELEPAPGTKSSRVIGLSDDIARSMSAISVRVAVVPGRNVIGIELPNKTRSFVYMRNLVESRLFEKTKAKLPLILGKDIGGKPILADLAKMPHLLVAGTTGSGKSVAVNSMILSLLYRLSPEQCRFIMIDPKMLELSVYDGIPHLLSPVVTEPGKAVVALKWTVQEMENRYRAMSKLGVRNVEGYNERLREAQKKGEEIMTRVQTGFDPETGKPEYEEQAMDLTELPYIVVIVDEFADLMLVAGKDVEAAIQRLAQMARAAGIHLIMATQRPSVDVITGVVKANFPTRISFSVTSKIDSRTILGEGGAEQLLGMGDMLYMAPGGRITRVHGPFVSDEDVETVVNYLKDQGAPAYETSITDDQSLDPNEVMDAIFESRSGKGGPGSGSDVDELYDQAVALVAREGKASTSFVQRYLQIGYNRAARIIEEMERQGVISKATKTGKREVLVSDYSDAG